MTRLRRAVVLSLVAACGHVVPQGPPDVGPVVDAMLTAIEPSIASTNDVITLEGTFGDTVIVQFPGGVSQSATVLGPHRATVTVPMTATDGDLTAVTGGATIGPLSFRHASFAPELGPFEGNLEQPGVAQQSATLVAPRASPASVVVGSFVYVLGGVSQGTSLNSVERATINADGSLGPFTAVSGVTLVSARYACSSTVVGSYLYVVGGTDQNGALNSVERARINADGSLGSFAAAPGLALAAARQGHTSAVVGNYLYVAGGIRDNVPLSSVERARIHPDGSLDAFETVPDVTLAAARTGHTSAVIGSYFYVVGGFDTRNALSSVEQATIHADGSLGPFAPVSGVNLVTARNNHTSVVLGTHLYVLGGIGAPGALGSVEQATINPDGSLGAFATVPGAALAAVSSGHTSAVIGNYLYLFGGLNSTGLNGTERAAINANGSLNSFATVPVNLAAARAYHTSAVIGRYLYLIGGSGANGFEYSTERATISADGSLGPFTAVSGVTLVVGRTSHTSAVIGNYLYVIGGGGPNGLVSAVERATINADGSLGPFATVSGVTLVTARAGHASAVIGKYVYVIGGQGSGTLTTVERAAINADGSLGPFATVAGVTLVTPRYGSTSAIVGHSLYVVAGFNSAGPVGNVEQATINADGSLGTFAAVPGFTLKVARYLHASAMAGNSLYLLGGPGSNSIERVTMNPDGSLGPSAIASAVTLTTARASPTAAVMGNYLYVVGGAGGTSASVALGSVERATVGAEMH